MKRHLDNQDNQDNQDKIVLVDTTVKIQKKCTISYPDDIIEITRPRDNIKKDIAEKEFELLRCDIEKEKINSIKQYDEWKEEFIKSMDYVIYFYKIRDLLDNVHIDSWKISIFDKEITTHIKTPFFDHYEHNIFKFYSNKLSISFNNELFLYLNITVPELKKDARPEVDFLVWNSKNTDRKANILNINNISTLETICSEININASTFFQIFWNLIYKTFMFDPKSMNATFNLNAYNIKAYGTLTSYQSRSRHNFF